MSRKVRRGVGLLGCALFLVGCADEDLPRDRFDITSRTVFAPGCDGPGVTEAASGCFDFFTLPDGTATFSSCPSEPRQAFSGFFQLKTSADRSEVYVDEAKVCRELIRNGTTLADTYETDDCLDHQSCKLSRQHFVVTGHDDHLLVDVTQLNGEVGDSEPQVSCNRALVEDLRDQLGCTEHEAFTALRRAAP